MDEIILKTTNQGIVSNAKELHAALPEKLKKYNYIVDTENYESAKDDRKHLNGYIDALKTKRKEFEETDLKPWFDAKAEIMAMEKETEKVSKALSEGIAAVDDVEKVAKMERIRENFNALELPLKIPFEKFYDRKKYDAKSKTDKKIMEDMQIKIDKVVNDVRMMTLFMPDEPVEKEQIKQVYIDTLDIGQAKLKADELKALHEKVANKQTEMEHKAIVPETMEAALNQTPLEVKTETPKKQRIVAGFIAERAFFDEMNLLVKKYNAQCKVIEREDM